MLIAIIILIALIGQPCQASEYIGRISTNPQNPQQWSFNDAVVKDAAPKRSQNSSPITNSGQTSKTDLSPPIIPNPTPVVKGLEFYPEGSLLKGESDAIYVVKAGFKKKIFDLDELSSYQGREIIKVKENVLSAYPSKNYWPGDLVRQVGREEVYFLTTNGKHHIKSLAELARKYFGQEIHNISKQDFVSL